MDRPGSLSARRRQEAGLLVVVGATIRGAAYFMPWVVAHGFRTVSLDGSKVGAPVLSIGYSLAALTLGLAFAAGRTVNPRILAGFGIGAIVASVVNAALLMGQLDGVRTTLEGWGDAISVSPGIGPWAQIAGAVIVAVGGWLAVRWTNLAHQAGGERIDYTRTGSTRVAPPPRPDVSMDRTPRIAARPTPRRTSVIVGLAVAAAVVLAAVAIPAVVSSRAGSNSAAPAGANPPSAPVPSPPPSPTAPPLAPGTVPSVHSSGSDAVAYQGDVAHDGDATNTGLRAPLREAWSRTWHRGARVAYPLIAGNTVFVSVPGATSGHRQDAVLYAFDADTGAVRWHRALMGAGFFIGMAFDGGRLFTIDSNGLVVAFDAQGGTIDWSSKMPNQRLFTSPPTAWGGQVFVSGSGNGGTLYAVDESTGAVRWTQSVNNGDDSAPTLMGDGVAVGYACYQISSFLAATGALRWNHSTGCSGGGGRTLAYHLGRIYARDNAATGGIVIDAATGKDIGKFDSSLIPAFDGTTGYFQEQGTLRARNLSTMAVQWSFAGDGELVSAPLSIENGVVVASSSGTLYALSATGQLVGSYPLGATVQAPNELYAVGLTGMNAGDGVLAVAATRRLVVFRSRVVTPTRP